MPSPPAPVVAAILVIAAVALATIALLRLPPGEAAAVIGGSIALLIEAARQLGRWGGPGSGRQDTASGLSA